MSFFCHFCFLVELSVFFSSLVSLSLSLSLSTLNNPNKNSLGLSCRVAAIAAVGRRRRGGAVEDRVFCVFWWVCSFFFFFQRLERRRGFRPCCLSIGGKLDDISKSLSLSPSLPSNPSNSSPPSSARAGAKRRDLRPARERGTRPQGQGLAPQSGSKAGETTKRKRIGRANRLCRRSDDSRQPPGAAWRVARRGRRGPATQEEPLHRWRWESGRSRRG